MSAETSSIVAFMAELSVLVLKPDTALIIAAMTGVQRRYWHQWAEAREYKHHHPVRTKHFLEKEISYCTYCNMVNYDDNWNKPFCICKRRHWNVGFNAVLITNSEIPHMPKHIIKIRGNKQIEKTWIEFPRTDYNMMYKIIDVNDI